jgi:hypothetical protein
MGLVLRASGGPGLGRLGVHSDVVGVHLSDWANRDPEPLGGGPSRGVPFFSGRSALLLRGDTRQHDRADHGKRYNDDLQRADANERGESPQQGEDSQPGSQRFTQAAERRAPRCFPSNK